ncbi:MAG TPA: ABC transporter ATP-binding protein [Solirubrobacterales bacterium]|nr:ABC transporter ATP-binding protein [Solirubrobacterales bacterium]
MSEPVISVRGLRKSYRDVDAVRGIDLEVDRGEIFAFVGPNGAGKTTTVEILEGYRRPSGGEATVLGIDPGSAGREWRQRVGIVLQECRMQRELTVRETLELYAGYYRSPRAVPDTIELVDLTDKADARTGSLSGGQRRRLDVGLALIGDPELVFLDEPTTGFDPTARRQAWEMIESLRALGKTVFLTTHYMEEAQQLADRVAIIVRGRIVAEGPPDQLGGHERDTVEISFRLPAGVAVAELPASARAAAQKANGALALHTDRPVEVLNELTGWALEQGSPLPGLRVTRPSLEDVYLRLAAESDEGGL